MTMVKRQFAKLSCGGNDFIIIDSRNSPPAGDLSNLARALCARRTGIGADGLIFLVPEHDMPFGIALYNSDGSKAEVSFNGSRCVGRYVFEAGIVPAKFSFASGAGPITVQVKGTKVSLEILPPEEVRLHVQVQVRDEIIRGHAIKIGVPYFVLFQDDLNYSWVDRVPPRIRTHPTFPNGTNVAVACRREQQLYEARFFERGVKEETLSSGSGCVSVALLAAIRRGAASPVTVRTKGGDFQVAFEREGSRILKVSTSGEVLYIYRGEATDEMLAMGTLH